MTLQEAEDRIKKLEAGQKRLNKRGARFKPPQGPEEVAMEAMTHPGGHLVSAEWCYNHYEAVGWTRGSSRVENWRALLATWCQRATENEKKDSPSGASIEDYYGAN